MVTVFTTLVVSLLELAKIMVLEESEYKRTCCSPTSAIASAHGEKA